MCLIGSEGLWEPSRHRNTPATHLDQSLPLPLTKWGILVQWFEFCYWFLICMWEVNIGAHLRDNIRLLQGLKLPCVLDGIYYLQGG